MRPTLFAALLVSLLQASPTPSPLLLVLSKGDHALILVDPATLKVAGRVPSGPDPHEVTTSADGKVAYISNYGGGAYHTITVVDLARQQTLPIIDLGPLTGPHGLFFAGGKLWFTAEGAKVIGSYEPTANQVDWVQGTGQGGTHMIFVWPDLTRVATTDIGSATLTLLEKKGTPGRAGWEKPTSR